MNKLKVSDDVIVVWDSGSSGRVVIDPAYKATRRVDGPKIELWDKLPYVRKLITHLGVKQAHVSGYEADDVLASLALKLASKTSVCIYTTDKDLYQIIGGSISVQHPGQTMQINATKVKELTGVEPSKLPILKAFKGDASDNIPKIPVRLMPKIKDALVSHVNNVASVAEFYDKLPFDFPKRDGFMEFKDRALLNETLLKFNTTLDVEVFEPEVSDATILASELNVSLQKWSRDT